MRGGRASGGMCFMAVLLVVGLAMSWMAGPARAADLEVGSDHPAAILVFPKLLVDTQNGLDTMIRISNTSEQALNVFCFYVNATPQCTLPGGNCFPNERACPVEVEGMGQVIFGQCVPQWQPTDFLIRLTYRQPTGWLVSGGSDVDCRFLLGVCSADGVTTCRVDGDCAGPTNRCVLPPCFPLDGQLRIGWKGQTNQPSLVPLSPEDPFIGELKCIAVDETQAPIARNDLIGEALIGRIEPGEGFVDIAGYNAIGIPAIPGTGNRNNVLVIGGPTGENPGTNPDDLACLQTEPPTCAEYEGCPNILILDHYFDGAADPMVVNSCLPDGTCSVSNVACVDDNDCIDNFCQADGTCSVTGDACTDDGDCVNTCVLNNECLADACTETGDVCADNSDCANNVCSFSGEHCLSDADCTAAGFQVRVTTELTLIPCTQDFESRNLDLSFTIAQYLVFNEFEQRFSTSNSVNCFREIVISNIDTNDNTRSIFSAGVAGTLTGQTRIRGVVNENLEGGGNTLLGIAEEFRCGGPKYQFPACSLAKPAALVSSTAKNLHFQGRRPQSDFVYLP